MCTKCEICVSRIGKHVSKAHKLKGDERISFIKRFCHKPTITVNPEEIEDQESNIPPQKLSNPGVSERMGVLKNSLPLSKMVRKAKKLGTENWRFMYSNAKLLLQDFQNWMVNAFGKTPNVSKQTFCNVQSVWKQLDSEMNIEENELKNVDSLEDYFFLPLFNSLTENLKLPVEKRTRHLQATTISSKLTSINHLLTFLGSRDIYAGLICKLLYYHLFSICFIYGIFILKISVF